VSGRAGNGGAEAEYEASFFTLRTPWMPVEEWLALSADLEAPLEPLDGPELEAALVRDREKVRARLQQISERPEVREAIFLASPTLIEALERWRRDPRRETAAERSLYRYFTRMATRPTPFGLFAGYSTGALGESTRVELEAQGENRRRSRLDMEYVAALCARFEQSSAIRRTLRYQPNSSLYEAGGRLRYARDRREGRARTYHLVAVDANEALVATLRRAGSGTLLADLSSALVGPGVSEADAEGFVGALVDHRILVSNLEPFLTGKNALDGLVEELERQDATRDQAAVLATARERLAAIDAAPLSGDLRRYQEVASGLAVFGVEASLRALFQVDVEKPLRHGVVGKNVLRELRRGISLLHALSPPRPDPLAAFRAAFVARYDAEEVPLVEALDDEVGVGFGRDASESTDESPLVAGLGFPSRRPIRGEQLSRRDTLLLARLERCYREHRDVLELTAKDVEELSFEDRLPLPDALAVMAVVAGDPTVEKPTLLLHSVTGPSGARMLGRFAAGDPVLEARVREHLGAEEAARPDAVFAEIVCQPQDRVGNVLARPVLRGYEIPFLGRSGAAPERQIPVTDLRVRVSGDRVVLRSERLGREVVPRLSTAHFHADGRNPSVYRFLAALQGQSSSTGLAFGWGAHEGAVFLPRVVCDNLILARARWVLSDEECGELSGKSGAERHRALRALRAGRRLPRFVVLVNDDNELVLDLESALCVDVLLERAKGGVVVAEWLPGERDALVTGPGGRFSHELVVPFVRRGARPIAEPRRPRSAGTVARASRSFLPGSEWLYVKLYGGESSADRVLSDLVAPLREHALGEGGADGWFFLRYEDPEPHLRLRFHGDPRRLGAELLPRLNEAAAPLLSSRLLHRVELGTYEREIERYGGLAGVLVAERVFQADSEAALAITMAHGGDAGSDARWRLALAGMHAYFDDFDLDPESRLGLIERLRDGFSEEFRAGGRLRDGIRDRFRKERASIDALLAGPGDDEAMDELETFRRRSAALGPLVAELKMLDRSGQLSCRFENHLTSYVHLFVNRVLRSSPRAHEFVLYEFLFAHYRGVLGKKRAEGRTSGG